MALSDRSSSLEQAHHYIYSIDFSMIIEKMVKNGGWRMSDALATAKLYCNFLYLNKKYPSDAILPPSEDIDEFWHYHILDTRKYLIDCDAIFGNYLHHYPYLIVDHHLNHADLNQAFEVTQHLHQIEFGEPIFATRSQHHSFCYSLLKLLRL